MASAALTGHASSPSASVFKLTLTELNTMLKRTGYAVLYAKDEWDALIIFALSQRYDLRPY
jgi:hypothetical protein